MRREVLACSAVGEVDELSLFRSWLLIRDQWASSCISASTDEVVVYNVATIASQDAGKDPSIIVWKDASLIDPPIALTFCQSS